MKDEKYMMVGELAKKMGISVRTLQFYDKENILKPSAISEGGHRLYTYKDTILLQQILSFKYLGFSLAEIKSKILLLDTPQDVAQILTAQSHLIDQQIKDLRQAKDIIDSLQKEIESGEEVDFGKYSQVIELLKIEKDGFWVWKNFDPTLREHISQRFSDHIEEGKQVYETYKEVLEEAHILKEEKADPKDFAGQKLAEKWWNMIMEFTGGDMSLLPQLEEFGENKDNWNSEFTEKQKEVDDFIQEALLCYLEKKNIHLEGE